MQPLKYSLKESIYQDLINKNNFLEKHAENFDELISFSSLIRKNGDQSSIDLFDKEISKLKDMEKDSILLSKIKNAMMTTIAKKPSEEILLNILDISLRSNSNEVRDECINRFNALHQQELSLSFDSENNFILSVSQFKNNETINILLKFFPNIQIKPKNECDLNDFKEFLKEHGSLVQNLELSELGRSVDDAMLIELKNCPNLKVLFIISLSLTDVTCLNQLSKLQFLHLAACVKIKDLDLAQLTNLETLKIMSFNSLTSLNLNSLLKLKKLNIIACPQLNTLNLSYQTELSKLNLSTCTKLEKLNLSNQLKLQDLNLSTCSNLREVCLEPKTKLKNLNLEECNQLAAFDLTQQSELQTLNLIDCDKFTSIDLSKFLELRKLYLSKTVFNTSDLNILKELRTLHLQTYQSFSELNLNELSKLEELVIKSIPNLTNLDISHLSKLQNINISFCDHLKKVNLKQLPSLRSINLIRCDEIEALNLVQLPQLQKLELNKKSINNEQFLNFIEDKLNSTDPQMAEYWCNFVIEHLRELKLHDEDILFQKAIQIQTLTHPYFLNDYKNPYRIYAFLEKTLQKEEIIPLSFITPFERVNNQNIRLNFPSIRKDVFSKTLTREDLPPGINRKTLENLFIELENRFKGLPLEVFSKTKEQIEQNYKNSFEEVQVNYEFSLDELKSKILNMDFVKNLLTFPSEPMAQIDPLALCLCVILNVIEKESPQLNNKLLSPKEEMFLAFAHAINNCPVGQKDGIIQFYNSLNPKDKIIHSNIDREKENKIKNYFKSAYQTLLNQVFSDEKLITNLTKQPQAIQASHQTFFLKNRFYKALGLQHMLKFDLNTGVLDTRLIDKVNNKPNKVAALLANHICPKKLCDLLQMEINHLCNKEEITYLDLYTYLQQIVKVKNVETSEWLPKYLNITTNEEDEFEFKGILEAGVLAILNDMEYIQIETQMKS